jgi:hypothetical protein
VAAERRRRPALVARLWCGQRARRLRWQRLCRPGPRPCWAPAVVICPSFPVCSAFVCPVLLRKIWNHEFGHFPPSGCKQHSGQDGSLNAGATQISRLLTWLPMRLLAHAAEKPRRGRLHMAGYPQGQRLPPPAEAGAATARHLAAISATRVPLPGSLRACRAATPLVPIPAAARHTAEHSSANTHLQSVSRSLTK